MVCGSEVHILNKLSRKDLQTIADRVLKAYMNMPCNEGKPLLKVIPETMLRDLLGLSIEYRQLSNDGSILGLTSYIPTNIIIRSGEDSEILFIDDKTILVEKALRENKAQIGRCNYTLMHEGAHQILKMLYPHDFCLHYRNSPIMYHRPRSRVTKTIDFAEWQANILASLLLMPRECVERSLYMFGFGEKIKMLNRIYAPCEYGRFEDMARFLGVSKSALHIRLSELGLIENDYYGKPHDVCDIRKD